MKQPHYPLERVKALVAQGNIWLSRKRAMDMFDTPREAHAFAARVTAMLSVDHFCETVQLSQDKADVYGLTVDDCGWYVKLYIDETVPETTFISLHPLERPIKTNAGRVEP